MQLILLRHGKAQDHHPQGDRARELLDKGRKQARRAGNLVKNSDWLPEIVLTSPLVRALQTADEFCASAGIPKAIEQPWIACGMHPERAMRELTAYSDFRRVAIVGHEPDLSQLIQWIVGSSCGDVEMKKGALAGLHISPPSRHGTLAFLIPPKWNDASGE